MYCNYLQDTVLNPVDSYFSDENLSFESCFNYETFKCRSSLPASPEEIRAETGFNRSISLALEDFATCMNRIATEFKFLVQFERRSYILQNDSYDEIDDGIQRNQRTLSLVKPNLCRARDFTFRTDCCIYLNDPNLKKSCPVLIGDLKCSPDDWQQAIMQLILYMYIYRPAISRTSYNIASRLCSHALSRVFVSAAGQRVERTTSFRYRVPEEVHVCRGNLLLTYLLTYFA